MSRGPKRTAHLAPHARLHEFKPPHLAKLIRKLCATLNSNQPQDIFNITYNYPDDYDLRNGFKDAHKWPLINYITSAFNPAHSSIVDKMHYEIVSVYGKGYSIRGRPVGSTNKDKPKIDAVTDAFGPTPPAPSSEAAAASYDDLPPDPYADEPSASEAASGSSFDPEQARAMLASMLQEYVTKTAFNNAVVNLNDKLTNGLDSQAAIIKLVFEEIKKQKPTIVEIVRPDMPPVSAGLQHRNFPKLIRMCNAAMRSGSHLNVWVYGPKGSGKTTAAEHVCKVLFGDLARYQYNGALASAFQVTGFMDATGRYVPTPFRQAWEHGGVYLFDEIDGSMPDALLALNGALANGVASFPDKMVPRHKDCIIIAGANTTGLGGTLEYSGRFKQDAALTDRFVYLDWPHDDALEDALCADKDWLGLVRKCRSHCQRIKYKGQIPSMRASLYGEALLATGLHLMDVIDATMRKGVADNDWLQISPV